MKLFKLLNRTMIIIGLLVVFSSCQKTASPTVFFTEIGKENSMTATVGCEMHLEAEIVAEGLIKSIKVTLEAQDGSDYEILESYDDAAYIGVKNTTFHEHIKIPEDAPTGSYLLRFQVSDQEDQITVENADITILAAE